MRRLTRTAHRLLDLLVTDRRHPEDAALVLLLLLIVGAAAAGWLD